MNAATSTVMASLTLIAGLVSPCVYQEIRKLIQAGELDPGLIPFARDVDDNYLAVGPKNEVVEWTGMDKVAPSVTAFLENFRDDLLSGRYELVEEVGLMEKVKGGGKGSRK